MPQNIQPLGLMCLGGFASCIVVWLLCEEVDARKNLLKHLADDSDKYIELLKGKTFLSLGQSVFALLLLGGSVGGIKVLNDLAIAKVGDNVWYYPIGLVLGGLWPVFRYSVPVLGDRKATPASFWLAVLHIAGVVILVVGVVIAVLTH